MAAKRRHGVQRRAAGTTIRSAVHVLVLPKAWKKPNGWWMAVEECQSDMDGSHEPPCPTSLRRIAAWISLALMAHWATAGGGRRRKATNLGSWMPRPAEVPGGAAAQHMGNIGVNQTQQ